MPVRRRVESSAIASISYSEGTQTLTIWFTRGQQYVYFNVTQGEYMDFLNAPSLGQYFNSTFKLAHAYTQKA